jgi:hypothetical protein
MKVLCSACSHEHDLSPAQLAAGVSCTKCGQNLGADAATLVMPLGDQVIEDATLLMSPREPVITQRAPVITQREYSPPRTYSMPSRAREGLRTATKDLFGVDPPRPVFISAAEIELDKDVPTPRASENSIMFSLESLMKGRNTPKAPVPDQLSENHLLDMQGTAPLFGAAQDQALLTTPIQPPTPPAHTMSMPSRRPGRSKRGAWKWAASALGVCGVAAAGWWGLEARSASGAGSQSEVSAEAAPPVVAPPAEPAPQASAALSAAEVTPPPVARAEAPPSEAVQPAVPAEAAAPEASAAAPEADTPPAPTPPPAAPTVASTRKARPSVERKSARAERPKGAVVGLPFNRAAAKDALTSASGKVSVCKGASGKGKVQLTFSPSGRVSDASITSGSFPAGARACILRTFRAARVPPFGGLPVSVAKSFKIP